MNWLMVAIGGTSGALSRYALMVIFEDITRKAAFPWVILGINALGSLLAGAVFALAYEKQWFSVQQQHLLSIGFLGAFTTYSTFSLDCVRLLQAGEWMLAGSYMASTTLLCFAATAMGIMLVRLI
jgi:fluoride exporter